MFRRIKSFLSARSQPCADAAARARSEAFAKVKEAEGRGDYRDYGRALMVLQQATINELQAAVDAEAAWR